MTGRTGWMAGAAVVLWAGTAPAQDAMTAAGKRVEVVKDGMGSAALVVDGITFHEDGLILLDPEPQVVGGVTVVTGVAGSGGNACNATPFVLALPLFDMPEFHGPVESCAWLPIAEVQPEAIVFAAEPVPSTPGEVWVWSRTTGFTAAAAEGFAATQDAGWEALDGLAGAHPVEALRIAPVLEALQGGLGADYPVFAERISELGSGDLTAEGYLGSACLKFTCEADWAVLYLHRETQRVFAIWHVGGEIESRIWPEDPNVWPAEAMAELRRRSATE